ncbi:hypothetical protein MASR2M36_34660 [Providencia sp.]
MRITANNPEQEEAEEIVDVSYQGTEMEIGFNVSYILDVLNALKSENVRLLLTDAVSSVQIEDSESKAAVYVVDANAFVIGIYDPFAFIDPRFSKH